VVFVADQLAAPSFDSPLRLVEARHGRFFVVNADTVIGRSLQAYGEWTEDEIGVLQQMVRPNDCVVDVGANIGCHTIPLAKAVGPGGVVVAFEPLPRIFQLLATNVTINGVTNARLYSAACGASADIFWFPELDYRSDANYGSFSINGTAAALHRSIGTAPKGRIAQPVPIFALDDVFDRASLRAIKIDVEGMEIDVLRGAARTIGRFRPLLYVENEHPESSEPLLRMISDLDYVAYWHVVPIFRPDNFRNNPENLFGNIICVNNLCIPREVNAAMNGFRKVLDVSEHPRRPAT